VTAGRERASATLVGLLRCARYEVIPTAGAEEKVLGSVPPDLTARRRSRRRVRAGRGRRPAGPVESTKLLAVARPGTDAELDEHEE
jgi:hypothetical protein